MYVVGTCILELLGMLGWGTFMYVINISYIYIYIYHDNYTTV